MAQRVFVKLSPSETAILQAAAQIFSAYIVANKVEAGAQERWIERSVAEATLLAGKVAASVQSDNDL